MATMRDVARLAEVSVSTVSHVVNETRVVNEQTRYRVLDAIEQTGWRHNTIARSLARGGTASIGLAITAISNEYFGDLLSAIEESVSEHGSTVLLAETRDDPIREYVAITTLIERRVDGLLVGLGPDPDPRTVRLLLSTDIPVVLVDRVADYPFDFVGSANVGPMMELTRHLIGHGHRRIGIIAGRPGLPTSAERLDGYLEAVRRAGLTFDGSLIARGGSSEDLAAEALNSLLGLDEPPTAIVTANNQMTIGVLRRLKDLGLRLPDDLALGSFDDFRWSDLLDPPLTAVAQSWREMGQTAVRLIMARIAQPDRPIERIRLPADLQVRRTCGCHSVPVLVAAETA